VHYAAELLKSQAHHEFEDTDIIKLVLDYGGDTNVQTKLVSPYHSISTYFTNHGPSVARNDLKLMA